MSTSATPPAPLTMEEKLRRAQEAYREYRAQCFWFSPECMTVTEDTLPFVIEELKLHGGHSG